LIKNNIMKNNSWLILFFGILIGIILMLIFNNTSKTPEEKELELTMQLLDQVQNQKTQIQYFEVKGKKGRVIMHTEISKDSAKILLGKPTKTEMDNYYNSINETWNYDLNYDEITDLKLKFRNGLLQEILEY